MMGWFSPGKLVLKGGNYTVMLYVSRVGEVALIERSQGHEYTGGSQARC